MDNKLADLDKQLEMLDNLEEESLPLEFFNKEIAQKTKKVKLHKKHTLSLVPDYYTAKPHMFAGANSIFSVRKSSSFFLLNKDKIVTNNRNLKTISYISNTARPNKKY